MPGYLIPRGLRRLILLFGRLPDGVSRTYANLLNKATEPFDAVDYLGSRLGANTLTVRRMEVMFDRAIDKLHRRLDIESDADLARGMYRFPTQQFQFHCWQLSLGRPGTHRFVNALQDDRAHGQPDGGRGRQRGRTARCR